MTLCLPGVLRSVFHAESRFIEIGDLMPLGVGKSCKQKYIEMLVRETGGKSRAFV